MLWRRPLRSAALGIGLLIASCGYTIDNVPPTEEGLGSSEQACVSLATLAHCGACNHPCEPQNVSFATCETGSCGYGECVGGFLDCDDNRGTGCETDPLTDIEHCGGCDQPCLGSAAQNAAAWKCVAGVCQSTVCRSAFGDCDGDPTNGCESSLRTLAHCGGCGTPCTPLHVVGETCIDGTCRFAACQGSWADCDADPANGCEVDRSSDPAHCGACGAPCPADQPCVDGACQPPPPPVQPFANEVEYDGWAYASLDDVPVDEAFGNWTDTCQQQWLELPYGWERAPYDAYAQTLVWNVVALHTWATSCMLFADGTSWGTIAYGAGWWCGCLWTECVEQAGDTFFRVIGCDRRILVRRKL
jgi:hypothetical protein